MRFKEAPSLRWLPWSSHLFLLSHHLGGFMVNQTLSEDEKVLHEMGYAQELSRRMGGFQNFAISCSIICILSGGFGSFPIALSTGGGFSLTVGCSLWWWRRAWGRLPRLTQRRVAFTTGHPFWVGASGVGPRPMSICWACCSWCQRSMCSCTPSPKTCGLAQ